jgi:hypothetical protein
MRVILLALFVVLIFLMLSFLVHLLWILAVVFGLFWIAGWALGKGEHAGSRRRWYGRF